MARTFESIGAISDPTKEIKFDIAGASSSTSTTLDFNQTVNRTISFNDDDGVVLLNHSENKTLTAASSALTVNKRTSFLTSNVSNLAGHVNWNARVRSNDVGIGRASVTGSSTNIYAIASLSDQGYIFNSDGTTFATLGSGDGSAFIRYSSLGNVTQAFRAISATSSTYMTTENGTDIYVSGWHSGTMHVFNSDGTTFATLGIVGSDAHTIFLVKYTSTGMGVWSTQFGSISASAGIDVSPLASVSSSGDIYVPSWTIGSGAYIFNSDGTTFATVPSGRAGLIVKYNSAGFGQWYVRSVLNSNLRSQCEAVTCDTATGDIYACGRFSARTVVTLTFLNSDASTFGTLTGKNAIFNARDGYYCKYSSTGQCQWINQSSSVSTSSITDAAPFAVINGDNQVYFGGILDPSGSSGNSYFYNTDGTTFATVFSVVKDGFLLKRNKTTGDGIWVAHIGQDSGFSGGDDSGLEVVSDSLGVYLAGYYSRPSVFTSGVTYIYNSDGTTFNTLTVDANEDSGFIVKYDHSGNGLWSSQQQGTAVGSPPGVYKGGCLASGDFLYAFLPTGINVTVFNYDGATYSTFSSIYSILLAYNTVTTTPAVDALGSLGDPSLVFEKSLRYKNGDSVPIKITVSSIIDSTGTSRTEISLPNAGTSVNLVWDGSGNWMVTGEVGSITYA